MPQIVGSTAVSEPIPVLDYQLDSKHEGGTCWRHLADGVAAPASAKHSVHAAGTGMRCDPVGLESDSENIAGGVVCGWRSVVGGGQEFVEDGRGGWHTFDLGAEPVRRLLERGLVEQPAKGLGHRVGGDLVRLESECGAGG